MFCGCSRPLSLLYRGARSLHPTLSNEDPPMCLIVNIKTVESVPVIFPKEDSGGGACSGFHHDWVGLSTMWGIPQHKNVVPNKTDAGMGYSSFLPHKEQAGNAGPQKPGCPSTPNSTRAAACPETTLPGVFCWSFASNPVHSSPQKPGPGPAAPTLRSSESLSQGLATVRRLRMTMLGLRSSPGKDLFHATESRRSGICL